TIARDGGLSRPLAARFSRLPEQRKDCPRGRAQLPEEESKLPVRFRQSWKQPRTWLLMLLLTGCCSWSGCARPDAPGRLQTSPEDVAALRSRLDQIDW
ncbi:MAG: hypothetical protein LW697_08630, partial [Blastopirellula sp.]|nr:hypothetical protein [Blastopirellula sp.]